MIIMVSIYDFIDLYFVNIDADGNKHCSLYVKYKLTQQEIDVIESVIRKR